MHPFFQHPGVRRVRIVFRWCRIILWLAVFLVLTSVAYLHLIGLPEFVKQPMLRRLLARGIEAQFTNMQLGLGKRPSIIVENAAFSRFHQPLSPRLSASRAELTLSWNAMLHARIEVHSLQVAGAQLQVPVSETNGDALVLNNVALEMQFNSNDIVRLNYCQGAFRGIQLDIIGRASHVSDMLHWPFLGGSGGTNGAFQAHLREVARALQKINFTGTPVLQIEAEADGKDTNSFTAELNFVVPGAHTPWGDVTTLVLNAACARLAEPGSQPFLQVEWSADRLDTRWLQSRKISCLTSLSRSANSNLKAEIRLDASRFNAGRNSFRAAQLSWKGSVTLASSNFMPLLAAGKLRATEAETPQGSAHELSLEGQAARARDLPPPATDWGPWSRIAPWTFDWQVDLRGAATPKLRFENLTFYGHWRAPQVVVENLQAELYGGHVKAGATLDVNSRELHCNGATDFDPHSISQLLKPAGRDWMAQFEWTTPPKVNARLRVVLPPWTNQPAKPAADVGSTLQIAGDFSTGPASFHTVPVRSAAAHVTYTNGVWSVSHLHAVRPEGDADLDYTSSAQTQSYHLVIDSHVYPKAALPLLGGGDRILDALDFKQPPEIQAKLWGAWSGTQRTGVAATVLATNFMVRGETVAILRASVGYTNLILTVTNLYLSNNECQVQAPWLQVNLGTKMVALTNASGTVNPPVLQRILRTNAPDWLKVIHFDTPPSVAASGSISLANSSAVDMHFVVDGQHFRYNNLFADHATGTVDWTGPNVVLTNIVASAYKNGTLKGWIAFVSTSKHGSDFFVNFTAANIDLSSLAAGITGKTNRLEGRLDGNLALNGPNTSDLSRLQGGGHIRVADGLLWDIKIFGLLSPVLSLFSHEWGHSRAREAEANFGITNGTVYSDDLVVRCTGFRINLRGKVDKNKQINARLEATLSREAPIIGPVLSFAFTPLSKMFEYELTGPLKDPVLEPVYVPRFITFLLHPFKSTKTPSSTDPPTAPKDTK